MIKLVKTVTHLAGICVPWAHALTPWVGLICFTLPIRACRAQRRAADAVVRRAFWPRRVHCTGFYPRRRLRHGQPGGNRGQAFGVWREPFIEVRVPLLFNLRRDPFERAQHNSNTYDDWFLDRVYLLGAANRVAGKFLMSMKEYPPSQTPGSFNLGKIQKQIEASMGGK